MEGSIRQTSEQEEESVSFMSDRSATSGGALHEMPRLANALLQKSKSRLEESRNLNREIREEVCSGMHGFYEMVLRLADSRNRHITEKERIRANYERRMGQLEAKYAMELKDLHRHQIQVTEEIANTVTKTFKEAEASRYLAYEIDGKLNKDPQMPETTAKAIQNIQEDVAYLRLEMGTLAITSIEGTQRQTEGDLHTDHSIRKEIDTLRKDLAARIESIGKGVSYADMARGPNSLLKSPTEVVGQNPNTKTVAPPHLANHIRPHFPLLIESSDPRDTSEDVVKAIKNNIDVIELGVGVNSIKKRRNQKVVMACDSADDRAKMEQAIKPQN